jgi:hypothetical protein
MIGVSSSLCRHVSSELWGLLPDSVYGLKRTAYDDTVWPLFVGINQNCEFITDEISQWCMLLEPLQLLHVVARFSLCERLCVALSLLPLCVGFMFRYALLSTYARRTGCCSCIAVRLYAGEAVPKNRLSWLKFTMLPSQSFGNMSRPPHLAWAYPSKSSLMHDSWMDAVIWFTDSIHIQLSFPTPAQSNFYASTCFGCVL